VDNFNRMNTDYQK